ncbi:MAG: hypothetical protein JXR76_10595 [Deltaproteobacteria bacterium]|nr:hypothetical protein [Deltaproteobacteria bacterium]
MQDAIKKISTTGFWQSQETTHALMSRLPEYRLSKFQRAFPARMAVELVGRYLLDVEATERFVFGAETHKSTAQFENVRYT